MLSNSAYLERDDQCKARDDTIASINEHFSAEALRITDPEREERAEAEAMASPMFAAGIRGFDDMRWRIESGEVKITS